MKSKVVLIIGLIAISQGAIPRNRASFCLWFPERCKSTTLGPPTAASTLDMESFQEKISQLESEISNLKTKDSRLESQVSSLNIRFVKEVKNLRAEISRLMKYSKTESQQNLKSVLGWHYKG